MNDPLLMRVLNRLANLDEQFEALIGGKIVLVTEVGDLDTAHQLHHKEGPTRVGRARVEHARDVWVIHQRQVECGRSKGRYQSPCAPKPTTKSACSCRRTTQRRPRSSKGCKSFPFKTCAK